MVTTHSTEIVHLQIEPLLIKAAEATIHDIITFDFVSVSEQLNEISSIINS